MRTTRERRSPGPQKGAPNDQRSHPRRASSELATSEVRPTRSKGSIVVALPLVPVSAATAAALSTSTTAAAPAATTATSAILAGPGTAASTLVALFFLAATFVTPPSSSTFLGREHRRLHRWSVETSIAPIEVRVRRTEIRRAAGAPTPARRTSTAFAGPSAASCATRLCRTDDNLTSLQGRAVDLAHREVDRLLAW